MPDAKAKRELLRLTQECAIEPQLWPVFLEKFGKAVKAECAALVIQDFKNSRGSVAENWGTEPLWSRRYQEHYAGTNIWVKRSGQLLSSGAVYNSDQVVSDGELLKTEFYNDFLRPQGWFYGFGAGMPLGDSVTTFVTSVRSRKAGPYRSAELLLLRQLMPHLKTAVHVRHRIGGLEEKVRQLSAALDDLPQGMLIAGRLGQIIFMNRRAETLVREKDGLWIGPDGLCASRSQDTMELRARIGQVTGRPDAAGGVLSIARPGKDPLKLLVAPIPPSRWSLQTSAALIWIAFPEPEEPSRPGPLQRLFSFTAMEARLAAALLDGKSLQEFAVSAGITTHTAKTHLKNLFSKTGVRRQSAFIRHVLSVVDQLGRPR